MDDFSPLVYVGIAPMLAISSSSIARVFVLGYRTVVQVDLKHFSHYCCVLRRPPPLPAL